MCDVRDRALLLTAFGSGGRRRGEVACLRVGQLVERYPVRADPRDPSSSRLPRINLSRAKATEADEDVFVLLVGRSEATLQPWLEHAADGAVFCGADRWGHHKRRALTPQAVNPVLKRRIVSAGLVRQPSPPTARARVISPKPAAAVFLWPRPCKQSQHKSLQLASRYYNEAERQLGRAGDQPQP
ncbi:MAG: hypothetical protein EKK31_30615 [Hyphomicrobiales bacterium]|nr:MAG: hypothetical protein EKK31_30615 [Hyphomicrobiales bacterium]